MTAFEPHPYQKEFIEALSKLDTSSMIIQRPRYYDRALVPFPAPQHRGAHAVTILVDELDLSEQPA